MSASVGVVFVAISVRLRDREDPAKDRTHGAQRVDFPTLDLLEQACELWILRDRRLEVAARTGGGDGEDLGGEVAPPAFFEAVGGAVRLDRGPELADARTGQRVGEDDRRLDHVGRA